MSKDFLEHETNNKTELNIKVAGVGTFGCNVIHHFLKENTGQAELITIDTDERSLIFLAVPSSVQLGKSITRGLGTGGDVNIGRQSALASQEAILNSIHGADILFLVAGLGRGTGSGAMPVIAEIARNAGIPTIALVSIPSCLWGEEWVQKAESTLEVLKNIVNLTIIFSVDTVASEYKYNLKPDEKIPMEEIKKLFIFMTKHTVFDLIDLIYHPASINIKMKDLKTILQGNGYGNIGYGASSISPAEATQTAIKSPQLGKPLKNYDSFIVLITLGKSFGSEDVMKTIQAISDATDISPSSEKVLYGISENHDNGDEYTVTIVAIEKSNQLDTILSRGVLPERHEKTYLHKYKCFNCKLHFIVYSWNKDLPPAYCPECGKRGDNFHWIDESDQPIFKFVPGSTPPPGFVKK